MKPMNLAELARAVDGRAFGEAEFSGVSTDSRSLRPGQLFVALSGPRFDGHAFIDAARRAGAAAALTEREGEWGLPVCVAADARQALGALARQVRRAGQARVIGVTGSNGKTTVKEMLAAICARSGPTLATRGNLNNDIGVPLTLFGLESGHRYAVIEMGANHQREIDYLTRIAEPDVAVVTNAGASHLEGFGGYEGVAKGKGELFAALAPSATAVINAEDRYAGYWRGLAQGRRVLEFGMDVAAAVRAEAVAPDGRFRLCTPGGAVEVALALPGRHNVMNALAASACALALDIPLADIAAGLAAVAPVQGRLNWKAAAAGGAVLDDTYNANPNSLRAALEVLSARTDERWLVLGDMAELGEDGEALHAEAGRLARAAGVTRLLGVGRLAAAAVDAFGTGARHYASKAEVIAELRSALGPGVSVLIKGSRSSAMEQVVAGVCDPLEEDR